MSIIIEKPRSSAFILPSPTSVKIRIKRLKITIKVIEKSNRNAISAFTLKKKK